MGQRSTKPAPLLEGEVLQQLYEVSIETVPMDELIWEGKEGLIPLIPSEHHMIRISLGDAGLLFIGDGRPVVIDTRHAVSDQV